MSNADGERIAPVTYLFGADPEAPVTESAVGSSPAASGPVSVDLGDPSSAYEGVDERVADVRAEIEREDRTHVTRDRREAAEPRAGKGSFDRINNVSMHALARRGMSSKEMRDYLLGREFEAAEVDQEVERLESVALLDDVALGETLVRTLRDRKGLGRSSLTAELRRRNLDQTAIEIALGGLDDDELERAIEIAHKRAGQLRSYDAETAKRRLGAFLMRKGYSGSVVSTAVQRALAPAGPTFR
jgi:SOS response regulatory protein OraA/RecX